LLALIICLVNQPKIADFRLAVKKKTNLTAGRYPQAIRAFEIAR
jgi:hypothetical protein